MSVIKSIFVLSILAVCLIPRETEAQATIGESWGRLGKCTQVGIETLTSLANKIVPTVYELKQCSGYVSLEPPNGKDRKITWYLKVSYEFFKKMVFDEPKCLHSLLTKLGATIKPFAEQISGLGCLDEEDYII
ncbi:uncharacterized protein LOC6734809 [Drosophila simulans]|uniref:ACP53C14B n=2 Tax=Drosophila simulans TaxID=7240 RepID=Q6GUR4_DROSI|nr:uncharacterized protein LOC6734809 [Drosophila simulans]AAT49190.1 ACP53C14B [Drosophila simulans]AAT49194.1 ACP53C14B [Drosophila simulans]AAT49195.1 ACP53C14B [Drosophila simulans]AAT49196.1 ACP53C14B [Drosophila simulans]EDX07397.1 Acp53C14b [Drosophila simulans]